jgi:hypothetical protein
VIEIQAGRARFAPSLFSIYSIVRVVTLSLVKEHSVAHPTELGECACRAMRVRDELEPETVPRRPRHICLAHQKLPRRARRRDRPSTCDRPIPVDVEACACFDRDWRLEAEQRIWKIEEVALRKVAGAHMRCALLEVDSTQVDSGLRPEQSRRVGVNAGVEVMDLSGEVREVILTSVKVQSNESERPLVDTSVQSHVDAAHEPHVCVKQKRLF